MVSPCHAFSIYTTGLRHLLAQSTRLRITVLGNEAVGNRCNEAAGNRCYICCFIAKCGDHNAWLAQEDDEDQ
eukprot:4172752-Pyramimonas_sp.AAC.1